MLLTYPPLVLILLRLAGLRTEIGSWCLHQKKRYKTTGIMHIAYPGVMPSLCIFPLDDDCGPQFRVTLSLRGWDAITKSLPRESIKNSQGQLKLAQNPKLIVFKIMLLMGGVAGGQPKAHVRNL